MPSGGGSSGVALQSTRTPQGTRCTTPLGRVLSSRLSRLPTALPSVLLVRGLPLHPRLQVCFKGGRVRKWGLSPRPTGERRGQVGTQGPSQQVLIWWGPGGETRFEQSLGTTGRGEVRMGLCALRSPTQHGLFPPAPGLGKTRLSRPECV